ncbi:hypothetical protein KDA23_01545 [Candidatus Saccharibacteria bacterium]|nr:hypothetical protein [Candidatus Saccharibacteria bacterium]
MNVTEKPTLVWDIDGVKAATHDAIVASANRTFGLSLGRGDFSEDFVDMTGQPRAAITEWWLGFCEAEFPYLEPITGMPQVVATLSAYARHEQLTSRRPMFRSVTELWTQQHYGEHVDALNMMEIDWDNDPGAHLITKAGRLATIPGAVCLVDDEPKHCMEVAKHGRWAVQFVTDPVSQRVPIDRPATYLAAYSPAEVEDQIMSRVLVA